MTIRFTCDQCGSVLKIKDELAGTDGKCPKCKKRFVVPEAGAPETPAAASSAVAPSSPDDIAAAALTDSPSEAAPPKPSTTKTTEKVSSSDKSDKAAKGPGPKATKKADDDDFDPVSFLMEGPAKKAPAFEPDEPAPRTPMAGGRTGGGGGGFSLDDDDEAPLDAPLPTKKWGARKDTAAAAADKSLGGSTSAAKDLLAKSMEESRVRAGEMPEEAPRFNFDFAGFFREFGIKGVGGVAGVLAAAVGVFWIMNSMVSSKLALPELGYVSGKITVGGKPQAGIKVNFSPKVKEIEGIRDKNQRARDSFGVTDDQGNYTLYYTQDIPGVKVGQCRVTMEASDPKIPIPPKYLGTQDVTEEVLPGNNPPKNFEL
jgi:hypothetical protein